MKMRNEIVMIEKFGRIILSLKDDFLELQKINKDKEKNQQEFYINKISNYREISVKLIDTLNILIQEDCELIKTLVIASQKTIDQLKEIVDNDEMSEDKINETLEKIFETIDTINILIRDTNNRKNRNNKTGNVVIIIGSIAGSLLMISKKGLR